MRCPPLMQWTNNTTSTLSWTYVFVLSCDQKTNHSELLVFSFIYRQISCLGFCLSPTLSIGPVELDKTAASASKHQHCWVFTVGYGFSGVWSVSYSISLPLSPHWRSAALRDTFTKIQNKIPQFYKAGNTLSIITLSWSHGTFTVWMFLAVKTAQWRSASTETSVETPENRRCSVCLSCCPALGWEREREREYTAQQIVYRRQA